MNHLNQHLRSAYEVGPAIQEIAKNILDPENTVRVSFPNPHPDAQWFRGAGLGLFMHWGIHSVAQLEPSWSMLYNCPWGFHADYAGWLYWEKLAPVFNPVRYDPEKWMKAAAEAGFKYAVLTTKHHDGYALWPSKYGAMNTGIYLEGRDLIKPYVDACRNHGLKVGFYFSPRDWYFPGCPSQRCHFEFEKIVHNYDTFQDKKEAKNHWDFFITYTIGQLHELLTNYGTIDLLWFDHQPYYSVEDKRLHQVIDWVRQLQPGIVTNDRWKDVAEPVDSDFSTAEGHFPKEKPARWWELCRHSAKTWGYCPEKPIADFEKVLKLYQEVVAWEGNLLFNVGPSSDGTMPPEFYEFCLYLSNPMEI